MDRGMGLISVKWSMAFPPACQTGQARLENYAAFLSGFSDLSTPTLNLP
jgi:hypothetical protein